MLQFIFQISGCNLSGARHFDDCAWDTYIDLGDSSYINSKKVNIPTVYITMKDGDLLKLLLRNQNVNNEQNGYGNILGIMYEKEYPKWNMSFLFVWIIGVVTVWFASWRSARDLRKVKSSLETVDIYVVGSAGMGGVGGRGNGNIRQPSTPPPITEIHTEINNSGNNNDEGRNVTSNNVEDAIERNNDDTVDYNRGTINDSRENIYLNDNNDQYSWDGESSPITHTGTFLVISAVILLLLVFAKTYVFMRICYALLATFATIRVFIYPIGKIISKNLGFNKLMKSFMCGGCTFCWLDQMSWLDFGCISIGVALGLFWIGFTYGVDYAENYTFYWLTKDVMG